MYYPGLDAYGPVVGTEAAAGGDDDIDLFGSDDEEVDEEAEKVKAQRLEEYAKKKANKPKPVAKVCTRLRPKIFRHLCSDMCDAFAVYGHP